MIVSLLVIVPEEGARITIRITIAIKGTRQMVTRVSPLQM